MVPCHILLVTDRTLVPADRGNRQRIVELVCALRELGAYVTLVTLRSCNQPGLHQLVDEVVLGDGEPFVCGDPTAYQAPGLCQAVRRLCANQTAIIIVEYIFLAHCLAYAPARCLKLIDAHDLMHRRSEFDTTWVRCTRSQEIALLGLADVVLAIQAREHSEFVAMVPETSVIVVPHSTGGTVPSLPSAVRPGRIMMVGSNHPGNGGLAEFIQHGWPSVRTMRPGAELHVYGHISSSIRPGVEGVRLHGYVPSLEAAYGEAELVVAPLRLGTGLKIKIIEALARGKAVLTTSVGTEGLAPGHTEALVIEDDLVALGCRAGELLGRRDELVRLEQAALQFARTHHSRKAALRDLFALLAGRGFK